MEQRASGASLAEIVRLGGPAQADEARRLLAALAERPDDHTAAEAAEALIDAYLHDPYLTRYPPARPDPSRD